jgi:uncharacterized membrane protein YgcG
VSWRVIFQSFSPLCDVVERDSHFIYVSLSLDDLIKSRRKSAKPSKPAARKPTGADRAAGRQRATRTAKVNARRGIINNNTQGGKPSPMDIEREVYRQTRMNTPNKKNRNAPRSRQDANAQVKARKLLQSENVKKQQKKQQAAAAAPPTWVTGTKRPPSKKAVNAAVTAMTENGFRVPPGMQMVISFAPAPQQAPPTTTNNNQNKQNNTNKNNNKGKQTKGGRGGGRGGGGGGGRGGGGRKK